MARFPDGRGVNCKGTVHDHSSPPCRAGISSVLKHVIRKAHSSRRSKHGDTAASATTSSSSRLKSALRYTKKSQMSHSTSSATFQCRGDTRSAPGSRKTSPNRLSTAQSVPSIPTLGSSSSFVISPTHLPLSAYLREKLRTIHQIEVSSKEQIC
ncbi:uncharacterized protein EI90DRAFT_1762546 [Cantharellus anzutake]|uniref:uncharacterized protein n=1 Tax=Cantharellus anzutake TaxID=1750568 RepID=UPI001907BC7E|nr:uncharacterized protein EI90DRAFT_1762546 [Cantharellus anzutake]KAF8341633.1 hypothetical protein EI90DRAFT_1762546 [Cantharellus anzutake]